MEKTKLMQEVEQKIKEDLGSFLRREYEVRYKTLEDISNMIGISTGGVVIWLKRYNIPTRTKSEAKLKDKKKPSKKKLERWYVKEKKTIYKIGNIINMSPVTVYNWLKKEEILLRTKSESMLKGRKKLSKEELERWYIKEKKTMVELAELTGVNNVTISNWLVDYDIPIRTIKLKKEKIAPKERLVYLYIKKHKTAYEIAELIGVSPRTIYNWLIDYNIPIRTTSEFLLKGKNKPSKEKLEELYIKENRSSIDIANMTKLSKSCILRLLRGYNIPIRSNKHRITSKSQYKSFLEQNPTAKKLSALSTSANGLSGVILDRLIQLYPNQLKKARTQIPKWIESLGKYLGPYTLPLRGDITPSIDALLIDLPERIQDKDFQQILFSIARDTYMQQFNNSPKGTLKLLETAINNERQSYVKELMKEVYNYYDEVYNLEIPGIKALAR